MIIARREVRDQFRDWRIIFPIVGLTGFFPYLMNFTARQALGFVQRYGATIIGERMVPFLLMIVGFFPISVSLVIALESFVGEKERGSIEPLLNTPVKDWQLYLGKLVSSTVPPLLSSFLGMGVYVFGLLRENIPLPGTEIMVQIVLLIVVQAVVMVSGAVVVSTQATSVRAANLLASFIIIPAALLVQGEALMMFWGTNASLWWALGGLACLAVLLVRVGLAQFRREELLGREIDVLNLRWGWSIFRQAFLGNARSLKDWYLVVVARTIRRLALPVLLVTCLTLIGIWLGAEQVKRFSIELTGNRVVDVQNQLGTLLEEWPLFSFQPVVSIWWQNLRVLLVSLVLGVISFGVLGVFPLLASVGLAGYLVNLLAVNQIAPWTYWASLLLPHGVIETGAAIIACAAVLRMGAILATPTPGKTIGEVWLGALADWAKAMIGLVAPLLFLAAAVEAWVTPHLAAWLFR
jgi:uncharacterized membrane protein SpoIIM required for sporulation/ABC-type transport system involved in multi-copper enzyme maturation permease subunit